jgi:uncharacterized protein (UPF0335 family)
MESFDFKKYHVKAMNASSEEEKAKINQELKDVYASLDEEAQKVFNEQLQAFLVKEYAAINSLYQGANAN